MQKLYFELLGYENRNIKIDLRHQKYHRKVPIIILLHGFKSFRNWGFIPYASEMFSKDSISINLDFSWNGIKDDKKMIYDVDIFAKNTISSMLYDTNVVINSINNNKINQITNILDELWNGEIILFGHSLGGAIAVNTSLKYKNIRKLILWAAISKYFRNSKKQEQEWKEKGKMNFKEQITGQELHLNYSYLEDKENNAEQFHILNNIKQVNIDTLIVHGKQDITVSPKEAEALFKHSGSDEKILNLIKGCGHTFGVSHPYNKKKKQLENALEISQWFINK